MWESLRIEIPREGYTSLPSEKHSQSLLRVRTDEVYLFWTMRASLAGINNTNSTSNKVSTYT